MKTVTDSSVNHVRARGRRATDIVTTALDLVRGMTSGQRDRFDDEYRKLCTRTSVAAVCDSTVLEGEILSGPLVWRDFEDGLRTRGVGRTYTIRSFEGKFQLVDDSEFGDMGGWYDEISLLKRSAERTEFEDRADVALKARKGARARGRNDAR